MVNTLGQNFPQVAILFLSYDNNLSIVRFELFLKLLQKWVKYINRLS